MITVKGRVKFRKNDTAEVLYGLRQWQNGKMMLVWPPEVANADMMLAPPWNKR
jgi:hypothetical protein